MLDDVPGFGPENKEVPVAPAIETPVEDTEVPSQAEENATIGIDPAQDGGDAHVEVAHREYEFLEEVELFGTVHEQGSIALLATEIGDNLVEEGKATVVEL